MRSLFAMALFVGSFEIANAQQPPPTQESAQPRFGVPTRLKNYPQASPKEALNSAIEAIEKNDIPYVLAQLIDPAFVEGMVSVRGQMLEPAVEMQLARVREEQRGKLALIDADLRIPIEANAFKAAVTREARSQAFKQLVSDTKEKLIDDPATVKTLRRFLRDGSFADSGDSSRVGLEGVKDQAVFLKKVGDRWFVENRQVDETKKDP